MLDTKGNKITHCSYAMHFRATTPSGQAGLIDPFGGCTTLRHLRS